MAAVKVAITVERELLRTVDGWVRAGRYPNRSQAIQAALRERQERWKRDRLAEEVKKLDRREERTLAQERLAGEAW
jgi:Arc/MetJ-type ribon-helix-helix transcriptional regulator